MGEVVLEKYDVVVDNVPAVVTIKRQSNENVPIYDIKIPKLDIATEALMKHITEKLAKQVKVETEEITDPRKMVQLKHKFYEGAKKAVANAFKHTDEKTIALLAGILLHRMYGLRETELLMGDNNLEEVAINNSKENVAVYHKKYGWLKTNMGLGSEEEIYNFASQIGRKVGRQITSLNPIMDAHLLTGDRVAATLFPISTGGNTITIRRFARNPWTIIHFISPQYKTLSKEIAAFLWQAIEYELNIMVAGGTASGKTSMLNALAAFTPPNQRIISIEDTREILLPKNLHWNWIPLTSRNKNPEGEGEVTMLDLIVASLRMRPDRMIVGEVRRREQAETMFEAMHTGHAVYTTMHADTVEQLKKRLLEPPISIPKNEVEALQIMLVQYRDRRTNRRRVLEVAEILASGKDDLDMNYIYRWRPRIDTFEQINKSIRVVEDLNLHTGMTVKEIEQDLDEKGRILEWMLKNKIMTVDGIGKIMKNYYLDKNIILKYVQGNRKADSLLK